MVFSSDEEENSFEIDNYKFSVSRSHSMNWVAVLLWAGGGMLVLLLMVACCCRGKRKGRVLVPPPPPPGTYPQQQYETPVVVPYPTVHVHNHTQAAPYPTTNAPYPTTSAPYPTTSPYPTTNAPYPTTSPYPTSNVNYPGMSPYQHGNAAPTAPAAHAFYGVAHPGWTHAALPPPYDEAVSLEKQPPYNPHH